jgi:Protein of unknown function (DUF3489)
MPRAERTGFPFERKHWCGRQTSRHRRARSTAPSALTDPGLVLVRGLERLGPQNERKGWIMSVELTDAQLVMLSAAAQREDLCLTAADRMKGAILAKVGDKLVKLGLVREVRAKSGTPVWRRDAAGQSYALKLTAGGLKAIAVEGGSEEAIEQSEATQPQPFHNETGVSRYEAVGERAKTSTPRASSKLARVINLLQRPDGATIVDLTDATRWLPHTTRAALTGLRKRGYAVTRERVGAGSSIYRISGVAGRGDRLVIQGDTAANRDGEPTPKATQAA